MIEFNARDSQKEKEVRVRILIVGVFLFLMLSIVVVRASYLHIKGNEKVNKIAESQYRSATKPSYRRGKILDDKGRELAISVPVYSVFANPKVIDNLDQASQKLSSALSVSKSKVKSQLKKNKYFVWLDRQISEKAAKAVEALEIEGVRLIEESKRSYPNDKLAAHVLGAVGYDSEALAGLELVYDKYLRSQYTFGGFEKDARGREYYVPVEYSEQADVNDVHLTIDKTVQFIAEKELQETVEKWNAKGGVVVVMEPYTGAILAMANLPTFDPNNYSKYDLRYWKNRAVTDVFEPGSTFKVVIAASAIESGMISDKQKFYCEQGEFNIGKRVIHDTHPYGELTLAEIVKLSSNIGIYKVGKVVGKDLFYAKIKGFGFGSRSGLDYPGEIDGIVTPPSNWSEIQTGNISFGQGIAVTQMQLLNAYGAIANGGRLMRPYIVKKIVNHENMTVYEAQPTVLSEPVSAQTARKLSRILEGVVDEGTGKLVKSLEYRIAGKTGTAQKIDPITRAYSDNKYWASFVGFAPVENPRLAVIVAIDEPQGNYYGGVVAAPAFKNIMMQSLQYLSVPYNSNAQQVFATKNKKANAKQANITKQVPRFVPKGEDLFLVPDLKGLTMREVLQSVGKTNVRLQVRGSGKAYFQSVAAGKSLGEGQKLLVDFRMDI